MCQVYDVLYLAGSEGDINVDSRVVDGILDI